MEQIEAHWGAGVADCSTTVPWEMQAVGSFPDFFTHLRGLPPPALRGKQRALLTVSDGISLLTVQSVQR